MIENYKYWFNPTGVCNKEIQLTISPDGVIEDLKFVGGCPGNLSMIAKLLIGKKYTECMPLVKGHTCGSRPTSCMDQLAVMFEHVYEDLNGRQSYPYNKETV